MKKIALLLCAILAGITHSYAEIYSGKHGENLIWEVNATTGVLTISGAGAMEGESDNSHYPWYDYIDSIQHVIIDEGVTTVSKWAFCNYYNVTSVSLPSTLDSIMKSAFGYTHLTAVTLPSTLHYLDESVFTSCRFLTSINIPSTLTKISQMTFDRCELLNNVVLPESVVDIDDCAFRWCSALNNISLGNGIRHIGTDAFLGTAYLKKTEADNLIIYFGSYCVGVVKSGVWNNVSIREGTTLIAEKVFYDQEHMIDLVLPNSLKYINDYAFNYCKNLRSITFGNSLLEIGRDAFASIDSLTQLQFPNSLQKISYGAFKYCKNLQSVSFGNSLKIIGEEAFYGRNMLTEVVIPDSVTKIGKHAFDSDSIKRVTIGKSLTEIGEYAFAWENIQSLTWNAKRCKNLGGLDPDSFTSLPYYNHIQHDHLESLVFGDEVEYVPAGIAYGAVNLESVIIPLSATAIGASAFEKCSLFTKVVIPDNVTFIEKNAFSSCPLLETVTIGKLVVDLNPSAFDTRVLKTIIWNAIHCNDLAYLPQTYYNLETIAFGNEVEYVPGKLIYNAQKLKSLVFPSSITEIGEKAFIYCDSISEISFSENLTQINFQAFYSQKDVSKTITCANPVPPILGNEVFSNGSKKFNNALLRIPCQSFTAYKQSAWNNYFKNYEASSSYQLLVHSEDETMGTTIVGDINCDDGTVQIEATPNPEYVFVQWSDGIKDNPRIILLTGDAEYIAVFAAQDGGLGIDDVCLSDSARKVIVNDQIYILRGDKMYTITGQEVR